MLGPSAYPELRRTGRHIGRHSLGWKHFWPLQRVLSLAMIVGFVVVHSASSSWTYCFQVMPCHQYLAFIDQISDNVCWFSIQCAIHRFFIAFGLINYLAGQCRELQDKLF